MVMFWVTERTISKPCIACNGSGRPVRDDPHLRGTLCVICRGTGVWGTETATLHGCDDHAPDDAEVCEEQHGCDEPTCEHYPTPWAGGQR